MCFFELFLDFSQPVFIAFNPGLGFSYLLFQLVELFVPNGQSLRWRLAIGHCLGDLFTFLFKLGAIFAKRVVHRKQELHFVLDLGVILWPPEFFSLDQVQVQISYISFLVDEDVLKQRLTELFFR